MFSPFAHNSTIRFKVCYHTSECYQALQDKEVVLHLQACGLGKMQYKLPYYLNMDYAIQFIKNYNRNTKMTKIIFGDRQEKSITLSIDAVRSAFALDIVVEPYVDLRKLGNKLERAANYESHKQRGGIRFTNIKPDLKQIYRLYIRVRKLHACHICTFEDMVDTHFLLPHPYFTGLSKKLFARHALIKACLTTNILKPKQP